MNRSRCRTSTVNRYKNSGKVLTKFLKLNSNFTNKKQTKTEREEKQVIRTEQLKSSQVGQAPPATGQISDNNKTVDMKESQQTR